MLSNLIGEIQRVVERKRVDGATCLVYQVHAVQVTDTRTDIEAQRMLLANDGIETVVRAGIPVAVHVVGLPGADACGAVVTITHGKGILDDCIAEHVPMTYLFTVSVSPLVTERELVVNGIAQTVITQTDVQWVSIIVHIDEVQQIRC